jgi:hypothetical protein
MSPITVDKTSSYTDHHVDLKISGAQLLYSGKRTFQPDHLSLIFRRVGAAGWELRRAAIRGDVVLKNGSRGAHRADLVLVSLDEFTQSPMLAPYGPIVKGYWPSEEAEL